MDIKVVLQEIERRIDYYEEQDQAVVKTHPNHVKIRASLKILRSLKKWIEKRVSK